ncbi:MAG: UDP-N-acetylmuramoyl-tripeptide--D-alanyl-D-alanine ligase [Gammaproteobacteria bacterium]
MTLRLSEIAQVTGGNLTGVDVAVATFTIDTRTLRPGDLYFAIQGERFDGNDFIDRAEQAGAVAAVIGRKTATEMPTVLVGDTRLALAQTANLWRQRQPAAVVGVTGSNGKTTVKEMTAAVLGGGDSVLYTRGNLNNDIGVPLTLLRLRPEHRYAVIEMGANHPGEIAFTARCAEPEVAVITNAGPAHLEGFGSIEGVARTKGELIEALAKGGTAVLNRDDVFFDYWRERAGSRPIIAFGCSDRADVRAESIASGIRDGTFVTHFELCARGSRLPVRLRLAGRHNVLNALAAAAAGFALGRAPELIVQGLESVEPVTGRVQPLTSRYGNLVIDDTYNANAASLAAALSVLLDCPGQPWVVLGAFGELGPGSVQIHRDIGEMLRAKGVARLLATGSDARFSVDAFGANGRYFESQDDLIETLTQNLTGRETILVKGSRAQHMERVVGALVDDFRT